MKSYFCFKFGIFGGKSENFVAKVFKMKKNSIKFYGLKECLPKWHFVMRLGISGLLLRHLRLSTLGAVSFRLEQ